MSTKRLIPKGQAAKAQLGGSCLAKDWLNTQAGNPPVITGKGKDNSVDVEFAVSGSFETPAWSSSYTLTTSGSDIPASVLENAISAGIKKEGYNVVLVRCSAGVSETEDFFAVVNSSNENIWPVA